MRLQKVSQILIYFNFFAIIIFVGFFAVKAKRPDEVVYVQNKIVFEKFLMGTEIKRSGEKEYQYRKKSIDSLYALIIATPDINSKNALMQEFTSKKEKFEDFNKNFAADESEKIWDRLSVYAKDFSKEKGYAIILGMQPASNVLAGADSRDITNDFIQYINKRYEGGN